jgi:hypothetical protein
MPGFHELAGYRGDSYCFVKLAPEEGRPSRAQTR